MDVFSRIESIEGLDVYFSKISPETMFASNLKNRDQFPSDDFLARALAAIPSKGPRQRLADCVAWPIETQTGMTPEAGFQSLQVKRVKRNGVEEYVWCLGEFPIFPKSMDHLFVTRAETGNPLMSMGRQVAMLINALSYHLVRFFVKEQSQAVAIFGASMVQQPAWLHWCEFCKACPLTEPLMPRSPDARRGAEHRIIDDEEHNVFQPDIVIYRQPGVVKLPDVSNVGTYLLGGAWTRRDIMEIRQAAYPEPLDYRHAPGHVIQVSQTLNSRSPAKRNLSNSDKVGPSTWDQRHGQAIGRAIRRVDAVRKLTGRLDIAHFSATFEERNFYLQLHQGDGKSVVLYPVVDAVAQPMDFLKLIVHIFRASHAFSLAEDGSSPRENGATAVRDKVYGKIHDMKQIWINHVCSETTTESFSLSSSSTTEASEDVEDAKDASKAYTSVGKKNSAVSEDGSDLIFRMDLDDEVGDDEHSRV